jgi:hypothetical protein
VPEFVSQLTRLEVGMRVRHADGTEGMVVRQVAAITGGRLNLVVWDDLSQTRTGDAVPATETTA